MVRNLKKQCRLINIKFLLLVTVVLKFIELRETPLMYHQKYFERDRNFCGICFQTQVDHCKAFFQSIELCSSATFQNIFNFVISTNKRATQLLQWRRGKSNKKKMIAKYFVRHDEQLRLLKPKMNVTVLRKLFFAKERLDGFQYCPNGQSIRFVEHFRQLQPERRVKRERNRQQQQLLAAQPLDTIVGLQPSEAPSEALSVASSELPIWLYMLLNVQPLLLPYLHALDFPVPATYANCGFTLFQEYAGKTLNHFYNSHVRLKLKIAKQLLDAALRFTYGFAEFRLYITDLNADNIAYNEQLDKLYIIDLDTVLIVDATSASTGLHRHEYIDCYDCFAYSSQEICAHQLSDLNLFAACQLLREDLKMDRTKGFLYPLPAGIVQLYPQLLTLLDVCVDCAQAQACKNRFAAARGLIEIIENILLIDL